MTIKPLGNRLVVKLVKEKTTSASGIIISTKEENKQSLGEVISIGPGAQTNDEINVQDLGIKEGDTLLFAKYAGEEVEDPEDSDTVYKILKANEVMAVVEQ
jgi:chaperonin GroES